MKERSSGYHVKANVYRSNSRYTRPLLIELCSHTVCSVSFFLAQVGLVEAFSCLPVSVQRQAFPLSTVWNDVLQPCMLLFRRKSAAAVNGEMHVIYSF